MLRTAIQAVEDFSLVISSIEALLDEVGADTSFRLSALARIFERNLDKREPQAIQIHQSIHRLVDFARRTWRTWRAWSRVIAASTGRRGEIPHPPPGPLEEKEKLR